MENALPLWHHSSTDSTDFSQFLVLLKANKGSFDLEPISRFWHDNSNVSFSVSLKG